MEKVNLVKAVKHKGKVHDIDTKFGDPFVFWGSIVLLFLGAILVWVVIDGVLWNVNPFKTQNYEDLTRVHEFLDMAYEESTTDSDGIVVHKLVAYQYKDKTFYVRFVEERGTEGYRRCYISFDDEALSREDYKNQHIIKLYYRPDTVYSEVGIKYYTRWENTGWGINAPSGSGFFFRHYDGRNPFKLGWTDWHKLIDAVECTAKSV